MGKFTVTIGIPAHNEAKNIKSLLDSIIAQEQNKCVLESVMVMCDGCTDDTAAIVREYSVDHPIVNVIDDGERHGKSIRINYLMDLNKSNCLVIMDADTVFGVPSALDACISEFNDVKVGLVAGADMPFPPNTFFESIVVTEVNLWQSIRREHNNGDTVHNSHGRIFAIGKELLKNLRFRNDVNGDDHFVYFKAKELGLDFKYAEKAIVYYQEPDNLSDFTKQRSRFHVINESMVDIFGKWVEPYYKSTPLSLRIRKIATMFLRHPILLPLVILLEIYMRIYIKIKKPKRVRGIWNSVQSTK